MNKCLLPFLVLLTATNIYAQKRLTLQDAIAQTLKHNYDIRLANLSQQQATANNTYGNAGFSPSISAGATGSVSYSNVRSDLANGSQQINPNAKNTNINPAVTVNWTIFDGGRMFLVKKQLNELEALSEVLLEQQMQTMVSRTIQMYAQVVLQQKQRAAIDTALNLAKTRMQLTELKYTTGAGAKVDYLQAYLDYTARQDDSVKYLASFGQACDSISVLIGEPDGNLYVVDDSLPVNTQLYPADNERLKDLNLSLAAYKRNATISHINENISRTSFLPVVSINGGYIYNRSTSATGFALFSQNYGPNGNINVSIPVFQGGNIRRVSKIASLQAMRDDLLYERQNTIIGRLYRTTWRNYRLSVAAYNIAKSSIAIAKENVTVQAARFRIGVGTTLESREAENGFVQAIIRLYTAEYNVKLNETQVLEIENKLIKRM